MSVRHSIKIPNTVGHSWAGLTLMPGVEVEVRGRTARMVSNFERKAEGFI